MTREEKIEKLSKDRWKQRFAEATIYDDHKAGMLAGIKLRDEELVEKLGVFDEDRIALDFGFNFLLKQPQYIDALRWHHEQIMKVMRGEV